MNMNAAQSAVRGVSTFFNFSSKTKLIVGVFVIIAALMFAAIGINNAGYRTVVQWPNGHTWVKFGPGVYFSLFGPTTEHSDVITFNYDKTQNEEAATIDQTGISVMYQAGGKGTVYGIDQFALPSDEMSMLKLHKAYRSKKGIAFKLLKPIVEEAHNLTAELLTSEEAYAEKRSQYVQWTEEQIKKGKYKKELEAKLLKGADGKEVWKNVPVISRDPTTKQPMHEKSDLDQYGITLIGHRIVDRDFEPKTLAQIATKREANMAIITAKANAEKAKQDAITSEEKGKANVMTAKYEQEVEKVKQVVIAEREKEVAVINATRQVDVAAQAKLEAEQKKLAAVEYKQEQILRGEGDGEYKRLVMESDGALAQKLDTYETVNNYYAQAIAKQKWVPEINMGSGAEGQTGNGAMTLTDMFATKIAKDLALDLKMKGAK
jgi:hypothetical protein